MTRTEGAGRYAVAGAILVAGPLARQLYYTRYPLLTTEAVLLLLGLGLAGALIAGTAFYLGRTVGGILWAALLFLFLGFELDLGVPALGAVALGCLAFAIALWRWRATITIAGVAGFLLAALPSRIPPEVRTREAGPAQRRAPFGPIIHIVLDEHLGIGGFRATGDSVTADYLTQLYLGRGFDVYPAAYSRWNVTRRSFASTLSLGTVAETTLLTPDRPGIPAPLKGNPYFERLAGSGYHLNVYQSANLDFCSTPGLPVETCVQIPPTLISNISYLRGVSWVAKARIVLKTVMARSSHLRWFYPPSERRTRILLSSRLVTTFRQAGNALVTRHDTSDLLFAHLLLPHDPQDLDQDCVSYLERRISSGFTPLPDSLRGELALYRGQVRCAHRLVSELVDRVDSIFGFGRAVIIVQGDHGSRQKHRCQGEACPRLPPATLKAVDSYRPVDFTAEFSTMLAVRRPGGGGTVHWEPTPVQDFLWGFIGSGFQSLPEPRWENYIYLNEDKRIPHALRPVDMLWAPAH